MKRVTPKTVVDRQSMMFTNHVLRIFLFLQMISYPCIGVAWSSGKLVRVHYYATPITRS